MNKVITLLLFLLSTAPTFSQIYEHEIFEDIEYKSSKDIKTNVFNSEQKTLIPFGEFMITRVGVNSGKTYKHFAVIIVSDTTIKFLQFGQSKHYKILKTYYINGNTLFSVSDPESPDFKVEFFYNTDYSFFEHTVSLNTSVGNRIIENRKYFFELERGNTTKVSKSFGVVGGYSSFVGKISLYSPSYGVYIDFGNFGLEYHATVAANLEGIDIINYSSNQSNKFIGGGTTMNLGGFLKVAPKLLGSPYLGVGIQSYTEMSVQNIPSGFRYNVTLYTPQIVEERAIFPYVTLGYLKKLGDTYTLKGGFIISKCSMLNVGVGINF